ncbi:MAG: tetratricopeptide repeat protein, partial [Armatimonadetes bacterium]|nr:tetratricopeptide repeat protein [Armatimonadota bacterium]
PATGYRLPATGYRLPATGLGGGMEKSILNQEAMEGMLREGQRLLDRHQAERAADTLLRLVRALPKTGPLYATACARLSAAYQQQGELRKAITMLRQAIKQVPNNASYRLNLAQLYKEVNNENRALTEARRALTLSPDLLEARELVAELLLEQGRVDDTLHETEEILKRSPRHLRRLDLRGTAYLTQGDLDRALTVVNQMILLSPADPLHHFKRAILLQQKGQVGAALASFLRVVEMDTESELAQQSVEAVQTLDDYQIRQILLLASEDALFRYRLTQNPEIATRQRGFCLSPAGLAALSQVDFDEVALLGTGRSGYHLYS